MSMLIERTIYYVGFICAQFSNCTLLFLILRKSDSSFGSYLYLMFTFAGYSIFYTWVEVLTQPVMHVLPPAYIVFANGPIEFNDYIGNFITSLYCGTFAGVISLLAAQFVFRYIAVCRPHVLPKVEGARIVKLLIPCVICVVIWFHIAHYGGRTSKEKQLFFKKELQFYYDKDSTKVFSMSGKYWDAGKDGEIKWNFSEVACTLGYVFIIMTCFTTIVFSGINISKTVRQTNAMSRKTLDLNKQLLTTLVLQTMLPFIMMYSPVFLIVTIPLLNIHVGTLANITGSSLAIYPSLEPLIAIFCIKPFRSAILCSQNKIVTNIQPSQNFMTFYANHI